MKCPKRGTGERKTGIADMLHDTPPPAGGGMELVSALRISAVLKQPRRRWHDHESQHYHRYETGEHQKVLPWMTDEAVQQWHTNVTRQSSGSAGGCRTHLCCRQRSVARIHPRMHPFKTTAVCRRARAGVIVCVHPSVQFSARVCVILSLGTLSPYNDAKSEKPSGQWSTWRLTRMIMPHAHAHPSIHHRPSLCSYFSQPVPLKSHTFVQRLIISFSGRMPPVRSTSICLSKMPNSPLPFMASAAYPPPPPPKGE